MGRFFELIQASEQPSSSAFRPKEKTYKIALAAPASPNQGNKIVIAGGRDGLSPTQIEAEIVQIIADLNELKASLPRSP